MLVMCDIEPLVCSLQWTQYLTHYYSPPAVKELIIFHCYLQASKLKGKPSKSKLLKCYMDSVRHSFTYCSI